MGDTEEIHGLEGREIHAGLVRAESHEHHDGHGDSSSDSEYQHALEVVFDPENTHRRKSSIVLAEAPKLARRQAEQRKNAACFVHSLLDKQRKGHAGQLRDIDENMKGDKTPNGSLEPKESAVHSRLLTKKQLSEMAMGVRDLSKKLSSLKLKLKVKTVFLLTKAHDETLIGLTRDVARWLLSKERDTPYIVYVENTLEHNKKFDAEGLTREDPSYESRLKYWTNEMARRHPHTFDFVVTLGGDGTVLYASWLFQKIVPPVLSFALGSLGFLTKFDFDNYQDTLEKAIRDGVTVSLRLRFESMTSIEIFGDDEHFTTVQADGICVATPTGSTAYNLAAGGSLCHPENPVILLTAICAHTLSFRPIILPDTIVLRVGVPYDARGSSWASFDGRERVELQPGDYVTVSASRYPFANVMPPGRRSEDWINSIRRTLQWNSRQRQKAFKEWDNESEAPHTDPRMRMERYRSS